jgi:hypothetical protein
VRFFRRGQDHAETATAETYLGLRQQVLTLTPGQLGDAVSADEPMLALLMETGYPQAVATLVAVADGSASLYFSNGGGIIGAGTHASVAEASRRWLELARDFLPQLPDVTDPSLPEEGLTQFVGVARDGLHGTIAREADLGQETHPLSPLFYAGHDVITQIRLATEKR